MKTKIIPYLKLATPGDNYVLYVEFTDGIKGEIDLSGWKGKGVFAYWNEEKNFKNFKINELNKLEWNEEIDMDPDALYLKLTGKTFETYARKMKTIITIILFFLSVNLFAQPKTDEEKLTITVKEFHQALVQKNTVSINQQTDKALTYGHSNGWVQTKQDLIKDFESGMISYESFKEDSISIAINNNLASVRFVAEIKASLKGVQETYHLKVLEVWIKKGNRWVLFARQSVKKQN